MIKLSIVFSLILINFSFSKMKYNHQSLYNSGTVVNVGRLNSGKYIFSVEKIIGNNSTSQNKRFQIQEFQITLKESDFLGVDYDFFCHHDNGDVVYAILGKDQPKQPEQELNPKRAWRLDVHSHKLVPMQNVNLATCKWVEQGDGGFPFPLSEKKVK